MSHQSVFNQVVCVSCFPPDDDMLEDAEKSGLAPTDDPEFIVFRRANKIGVRCSRQFYSKMLRALCSRFGWLFWFVNTQLVMSITPQPSSVSSSRHPNPCLIQASAFQLPLWARLMYHSLIIEMDVCCSETLSSESYVRRRRWIQPTLLSVRYALRLHGFVSFGLGFLVVIKVRME